MLFIFLFTVPEQEQGKWEWNARDMSLSFEASFFNVHPVTEWFLLYRWEAKLENSALALGLVGNICLAFLFFPVSRGSSILRFIGLTSEGSIKYHIWLGHTALTLFTAHGLCYIIFWDKTHKISEVSNQWLQSTCSKSVSKFFFFLAIYQL